MSKLFFTIIYKSGTAVTVQADRLKVTRSLSDAEITGMEWEGMEPSPLHIGINDIAAVWEGKL